MRVLSLLVFALLTNAAALSLAADAPANPPRPQAAVTEDARLRRELIEQSIASYPGTCACPYSTMRNGQACGRRSAYSRPGGYSPLCYDNDVTPETLRQRRAQAR